MKLLLTSAGIKNKSIAKSLDNLVGKKRKDIRIGFIPTSANGEPGSKNDWFTRQITDLYDNKFKWIDIIDFSADGVDWRKRLDVCDVVYIGGGNTFHLLNQVRKHKFDKWVLSNVDKKIFVGSSAGSILFTPTIKIATVEPADINYIGLKDLKGLGLVDFEISPHTPEILTYKSNKEYAQKSKYSLYVLDDDSAVLVSNKTIEVVSEGKWKFYKQ